MIPDYTAQAIKAFTGVDPATAAGWEMTATRSLDNPTSVADYQRVRQLIREAWLASADEHV